MHTTCKRTARRLAAIVATTVALVGLTAQPADSGPEVDNTQQPARVVVVDRTAGTWHGVAQAARSWDRSEHVSITVAGECDPTAYCVVIEHPSDYDADWLGWWHPVAVHVSLVRLNRDHPGADSPRAQQWVVCHEVGHALGLGEVYTGAAGCMVDDWQRDDLPTGATARDLGMLDSLQDAHAPARTAVAHAQALQD